MAKLAAASLAAIFTLLAFGSLAAEMTHEQRAELRERATGLQIQRAQNPAWDGGTSRLNDSRGEVQLDRPRGDVKMKSPSEVKRKRAKSQKAPREPAEDRVKRSGENLPKPGTLVRHR